MKDGILETKNTGYRRPKKLTGQENMIKENLTPFEKILISKIRNLSLINRKISKIAGDISADLQYTPDLYKIRQLSKSAQSISDRIIQLFVAAEKISPPFLRNK